MFPARAVEIERGEMPRRAVSGVLSESVDIKSAVQLMHEAISSHFRDDRRGRDAEAKRIAVNEPSLRGGVLHQKGVAQEAIGFQREVVNGAFEGNPIGRAETEHIKLFSFDDSNGYRQRRFANNAKRGRSLACAQRFGVADKWTKLADAVWIQDDSGGNKRSGERSPPGFINSGDARISTFEKCGFVLISWGRNCHVHPVSENENGTWDDYPTRRSFNLFWI